MANYKANDTKSTSVENVKVKGATEEIRKLKAKILENFGEKYTLELLKAIDKAPKMQVIMVANMLGVKIIDE